MSPYLLLHRRGVRPARRLLTLLASAVAVALLAAPVPSPAHAAPLRTPDAPSPRQVAVGSNPQAVAIAGQLGKAFVVNDGSVTEVSLLTHRRLADFSTGADHGQSGIALVQRETQAYITNDQTDTVVVVDTETRRVTRRIKVGALSIAVAKANTPRGQRAYVALYTKNQLIGVQTRTGTIAQRVKLPHATQSVATEPGGERVWAGSTYDGHIYRVSTTSGKLTSINVGRVGPVTSIAFTPNGKRAWVAGLGGVGVVDTRTGKTRRFIPILKVFRSDAPNMGALVLTGSGRYAYVQDSTFPDAPRTGSIAMIDTRTYRVVHRVLTGVEPIGLAVDDERHTAYSPDYADDTITYFNVPR